MNKILKYTGVPLLVTLGWAGYLFIGYFTSGRRIEGWEGLLLLGMMAVIICICESIQPSYR